VTLADGLDAPVPMDVAGSAVQSYNAASIAAVDVLDSKQDAANGTAGREDARIGDAVQCRRCGEEEGGSGREPRADWLRCSHCAVQYHLSCLRVVSCKIILEC